MNLQTTIKSHSLSGFFVLTYGFSWILWSVLIFTTPPGELLRKGPTPIFLLLAILGGLGPTLAAVLVAGAKDGRAGLKNLFSQPGAHGASILWGMAALLAAPVINLLLLILFAQAGNHLPLGEVGARLGLGLSWPLLAALGEEIGWRGFALPYLQTRYSPLTSALWIGLAWGLWHLPADYLGIGDQGGLFWLDFLLLGPMLLTAYSVLITFFYNRTQSLWVAVLFHYGLTFSAIVLAPQGLSARASLQVNIASVALAWLAAIMVIRSTRGMLGKREEA